ncbi:hypothetical protein A2U01_0063498, partial [Trifolium medium]|nr:hypothetical protein [Trifolium medium]
MKLYLLDRGLHRGSDFAKAIGIEEIKTLDDFFEKAKKYIAYEEKQVVAEVRRPKSQDEAEVSSADFKKADIQFPKQLPAKPNMDRSKYCRYHR